jgi:hypothetical protein
MRTIVVALLPMAATAPAQAPRVSALADFGRCISRQASGAAQALLATEAGAWEEYRQARGLIEASPNCGRPDPGVRVGDVRGIVAEAMLEADADARARLAARPPAPVTRVSAQLDGRAFVTAYAGCLADAEPAKGVALLATPHRSQAELDAFTAFGQTLGDCLPEGANYRIDRFDVRNHIAAHLYRVAAAAEVRQ